METKLSLQAGQKCRSRSSRESEGKPWETEGNPWVCARRYKHPHSRKGGNKKALLCGLSNDFRLSTDDTKVTSAIARREKLDPLRREMP
jgi:hypothetical protein